MCGPSTTQDIVPGDGPIVSSPTSSDLDLTIHSSCARCHHFINKEVFRVPKDLQGQGADVICRNCGNRIMKLGRESTHSSFASQETTPPPVERTDSTGTGEAQGGLIFPRNSRHSLTISTWAANDHIPVTVAEVNSANSHGDNSLHGSFFPGDDAASTSEEQGQHPRGNTARLDFAPTATSTRPPSTVRTTSHQAAAADVSGAAQETSRPGDVHHPLPQRPRLFSKLKIRDRTQGLVAAISRRAGDRLLEFRRAFARKAHSTTPRSRSTSRPETAHKVSISGSRNGKNSASGEGEWSAGEHNQQKTTEGSGQPRSSDADGIREDTDRASLNSEPQTTAVAEGGNTPAIRAAKERKLAEKRRNLTLKASTCRCECPAYQHYALISRDIDIALQDGSTRSSTPVTIGRGRSMNRHGSLRWPTAAADQSAERFLQRGTCLSGVTVAPSSEAVSSNETRAENDTTADENDSTRARSRRSSASIRLGLPPGA